MGLGPNLLTQTDSARHGLQPAITSDVLWMFVWIIIVLEFTRSDIYFPGHVRLEKACLLNWAIIGLCGGHIQTDYLLFSHDSAAPCFPDIYVQQPPERDSSPLIMKPMASL